MDFYLWLGATEDDSYTYPNRYPKSSIIHRCSIWDFYKCDGMWAFVNECLAYNFIFIFKQKQKIRAICWGKVGSTFCIRRIYPKLKSNCCHLTCVRGKKCLMSKASVREWKTFVKCLFQKCNVFCWAFGGIVVNADNAQNVSGLCAGARRSFFCRMKYKSTVPPKQNATSTPTHSRRKEKSSGDKKYIVVHCTGYLKSWASAKMGFKEQETDCNGYSCNLSCLVAIGRTLPDISHPNAATPTNYNPTLRKTQFFSRHTVDGKFLFIDQRWVLDIPKP